MAALTSYAKTRINQKLLGVSKQALFWACVYQLRPDIIHINYRISENINSNLGTSRSPISKRMITQQILDDVSDFT